MAPVAFSKFLKSNFEREDDFMFKIIGRKSSKIFLAILGFLIAMGSVPGFAANGSAILLARKPAKKPSDNKKPQNQSPSKSKTVNTDNKDNKDKKDGAGKGEGQSSNSPYTEEEKRLMADDASDSICPRESDDTLKTAGGTEPLGEQAKEASLRCRKFEEKKLMKIIDFKPKAMISEFNSLLLRTRKDSPSADVLLRSPHHRAGEQYYQLKPSNEEENISAAIEKCGKLSPKDKKALSSKQPTKLSKASVDCLLNEHASRREGNAKPVDPRPRPDYAEEAFELPAPASAAAR